MKDYLASLPSYPVLDLGGAIRKELEDNRITVIQAPPGSGKSTLVPFFLLESSWRHGRKILLLQPRRAAARALAARLDELGGGEVSVGFITRYERSIPKDADILVMTEGIFTRKLLDDPELSDTAAVIMDEFHERSLATDLAYVLGRQCRDLFRPDLRLLVMSATLDTALFSEDQFAVLNAEGSLHPVSVEHRPAPPRSRIETHGAKVCRECCEHNDGSILFFLPGEAEIRRAAGILDSAGLPDDITVFPLYGRLSPKEQARAIAPPGSGRRKIVLATNIAETSLTIEGISCVIDSGLRRRSRWDSDTGLPRMETVRISAASAAQRSGRAGRLGPGRVIRLWEQSERLESFDKPEILEADLTGLFLNLAVWGDPEGTSCPWPDPPEEERRQQALQLLRELSATDEELRVTPKGEAMARMPVAPRLAAMLLGVYKRSPGELATAALTAAILEHGDPVKPDARDLYGSDLDIRVDLIGRARNGGFSHELSRSTTERILQEAERLEKIAVDKGGSNGAAAADGTGDAAPASPGELLLRAYPDRLGRRTASGSYKLSSGPEARLLPGRSGFAPDWIVAGALHRSRRQGLIYLAAGLSEEKLRDFAAKKGIDREELSIDEGGMLRARSTRSIGSLEISATPIRPSQLRNPHSAVLKLLRETGLNALTGRRNTEELRGRIMFLREVQGEQWPDVSDEALKESLEEWLLPFLPRVLKKDSLPKVPINQALRSMIPWDLQHRFDDLAPEQIKLPSGSHRRLRYEGGRCILSARIQQLFGMTDTPRVAGLAVEIELLSPAQRPMQVTRDLNSFWQHTYPEVRKELRGRYPKHYWPEDPLKAEATDRIRPQKPGE